MPPASAPTHLPLLPRIGRLQTLPPEHTASCHPCTHLPCPHPSGHLLNPAPKPAPNAARTWISTCVCRSARSVRLRIFHAHTTHARTTHACATHAHTTAHACTTHAHPRALVRATTCLTCGTGCRGSLPRSRTGSAQGAPRLCGTWVHNTMRNGTVTEVHACTSLMQCLQCTPPCGMDIKLAFARAQHTRAHTIPAIRRCDED
eukprot:155927-Chlamydomonas_euryale.AAC.2